MLSLAIAFALMSILLSSPRLLKLSLPFQPSLGPPLTFRTIYRFSRPHTILCTTLATVVGYALVKTSSTAPDHLPLTFARILVSGILANIFIVGINQLTDVSIDRHNKKPLPVADGSLTWNDGFLITIVACALSLSISYFQSTIWFAIICALNLTGYCYSVEPFRFKNRPILAISSIVLCRGVLGTLGGTIALCEAFDLKLSGFATYRLLEFNCIMSVFTACIAVLKDKSDVIGDEKEGVRTVCVQFGCEMVDRVVKWVLVGLLCSVIAIELLAPVAGCPERFNSLLVYLHGSALVWLLGSWNVAADSNYLGVLWPLVYFEFVAFGFPIGLEMAHDYFHSFDEWGVVIFSLTVLYAGKNHIAARRCSTQRVYATDPRLLRIFSAIKDKTGFDLPKTFRILALDGTCGESALACFELADSLLGRNWLDAVDVSKLLEEVLHDEPDEEGWARWKANIEAAKDGRSPSAPPEPAKWIFPRHIDSPPPNLADCICLIACASELQTAGLVLHADLVTDNWPTDRQSKFAVLFGDWLLVSAVMLLARVQSHAIARIFADGIDKFVLEEHRSGRLPMKSLIDDDQESVGRNKEKKTSPECHEMDPGQLDEAAYARAYPFIMSELQEEESLIGRLYGFAGKCRRWWFDVKNILHLLVRRFSTKKRGTSHTLMIGLAAVISLCQNSECRHGPDFEEERRRTGKIPSCPCADKWVELVRELDKGGLSGFRALQSACKDVDVGNCAAYFNIDASEPRVL